MATMAIRIIVDFFHRVLRIYGPSLLNFLYNLMLTGKMVDSIDAYAITYLFTLENTRYIFEMRSYIQSNNVFAKLFSKTIFSNDISIFTDPENKIIKLRQLAFAVYGKMITKELYNDYFCIAKLYHEHEKTSTIVGFMYKFLHF